MSYNLWKSLEEPFSLDLGCRRVPTLWTVTHLPSGVVVAPTLEAENSVEARKIAASEYGGDPGQYLAERWGVNRKARSP